MLTKIFNSTIATKAAKLATSTVRNNVTKATSPFLKIVLKNGTDTQAVITEKLLKNELCYFPKNVLGIKKELTLFQCSLWFFVFVNLMIILLGFRYIIVKLWHWWLVQRTNGGFFSGILSNNFTFRHRRSHGQSVNKSSNVQKSRNTEILLGDFSGRSNP